MVNGERQKGTESRSEHDKIDTFFQEDAPEQQCSIKAITAKDSDKNKATATTTKRPSLASRQSSSDNAYLRIMRREKGERDEKEKE